MTDEELVALNQTAHQLLERIEGLNRQYGGTLVGLTQKARTNRHLIWLIGIGFALDIILTIFMAFGGLTVVHNSQRIEKVQEQLGNVQHVQHDSALCPLYKLFINSENRVPPNQTPEQLAERAAAFKIIHDSYDALQCE